MSKPPRKSIISSFSALAAGAPPSVAPSPAPSPAAPEQKAASHIPIGLVPPRVAAGVVGATQRTLTDIRREHDALQSRLADGGSVEVDPALVDPSPFQDRLPDDDAAAFEALKASMAEDGQTVPVQLRRHPDMPGRYQLVYGHRRWRAAAALGLKLKAIIVALDDKGLAIAQGLENSARQDLSWIEKALFAFRMEQAGVRARDIRAALGVDDPELARFRQVCRVLGLPLIEAIGRAPKAGRPRWVELAARLSEKPVVAAAIEESLAAAKDRPSDERFLLAAAVMAPRAPERAAPVALRDEGGRVIGKAEFGSDAIRLKLDRREAEAFSAFFRDALPELLRRFRAGQGAS